MTSYQLGINTCFAVKRWPRPDDWAPIVAGELGLDVVQHSLDLVDLGDGVWEDEAAGLRTVCGTTGLHLHSTFTGLAAYSSNLLLHPDEARRARAEDWYERVIRFSSAAGAAATGGHVAAYSVDDWRDAGRREELSVELEARLERLARLARPLGVEAIYVENLASAREPSTMADIERFTTAGDRQHAAIQLCLDIGHQCVPGTSGPERDPYAWLATWGKRAGLVQLQQSDAVADHHWPFTETTNAQGRIEGGAVLDSLAASGATDVMLILEVIPPFEADDDEVLRDLVSSVGYWRDAIAAASEPPVRAAT